MGTFYTDVIQKDPRFHTLNQVNDTGLLEPVTRAAVGAMIAEAKAKGIQLKVGETYRSAERQKLLFDKGATKLRNVGVHHFGLACDLWRMDHGQVDWQADYRFLGALAEKHGLVWGGDWGTPHAPHNFRDYDHVQRATIGSQPVLFSGHWYPNDQYNPLRELGRA